MNSPQCTLLSSGWRTGREQGRRTRPTSAALLVPQHLDQTEATYSKDVLIFIRYRKLAGAGNTSLKISAQELKILATIRCKSVRKVYRITGK